MLTLVVFLLCTASWASASAKGESLFGTDQLQTVEMCQRALFIAKKKAGNY